MTMSSAELETRVLQLEAQLKKQKVGLQLLDFADGKDILDGVTDAGPAIQKAIRWSGRVTGNDPYAKLRGSLIWLPPGQLAIKTPIDVDRCIMMIGMGGGQSYGGTEILAAPDLPYVFCIQRNTSTGSGEGSMLSNFKMLSPQDSAVISDGILVNNKCTIAQVSLGTYGKGFSGSAIRVHGTTADNPDTNANGTVLDGVMGIGNRHTLWVEGNNSNICHARSVYSSGSLNWGIVDESQLGNAYDACHCSGSKGFRAGYTGGVPGVSVGVAANVSNRSSFTGCYSESGTAYDFATQNINVFGGNMGHKHAGTSLLGRYMRRLQVGLAWTAAKFSPYQRSFEPDSYLERYSHETSAYTDTPQAGVIPGHPIEWEFRKSSSGLDGIVGMWLHRWLGSNPNYSIPFMWSDADAFCGPGHFFTPNGLWMGRATGGAPKEADMFHITSAPALPTTGAWREGTIVLLKKSTPNGVIGYRCMASGTYGTAAPPTWQQFGRLEPIAA